MKIKDFIVPNNAGEDFCRSDYDDMTYDIQLQLGGERERERMLSYARGGLYYHMLKIKDRGWLASKLGTSKKKERAKKKG